MRLDNLIFLMFWIFQFVKICAWLTGFFTKREYLSVQVMTSALGLIGTVSYELINGFDWQLIFVFTWTIVLRIDYKAWKKHKDDDDDEHRKKRWSWAKNHLPKPVTRTIPQPI